MRKEVQPRGEEERLNSILYLPEGDLRERPLLVYLHGAGERGENISHLERLALPGLIAEGKEVDAIVLCPQCPADCVWENVLPAVKALADRTAARFSVLRDRICITGSSMGGFGAWSMGLAYRNYFSGLGPVAGGSMTWRCSNLRTTPVYAVHGTADDAVPSAYSEMMVRFVNRWGGSAKLLLLENYGHNEAIRFAYESTDLLPWLLKQRRKDFSSVPESLSENF